VLASGPSSAATPSAPVVRTYARREPETTVLHRVIREHLETFLQTVREERGKALPRYVEEELRRYVRCGILAHGFLRVVCPKCRQEIVVAYSCKCRGACPSCSARRMCDAAAHLVDHVLPDVPVRQWVLTAPHEVRRVLALRPDALTAQGRIFVEEIARWQKHVARTGGKTGAVTFVQRFDSSLVVLYIFTSWCLMASSPARTTLAPSCFAKAPRPRVPTSRTSPRASRSACAAGCAAAVFSTSA
jgi:transposase-like zinc-binding protein